MEYFRDLPSTAIRGIAFEAEIRRLTVQFQNGGVYEYQNVPAELVRDWLNAPSLGSYYSKNVCNRYTGKRLEPDEEERFLGRIRTVEGGAVAGAASTGIANILATLRRPADAGIWF